MRIVSIIHAASLVLVLAVPATEAQAKGRRGFGGIWTAAHAPVPLRGSGLRVTPVVATAPAIAGSAPAQPPREAKAPEAGGDLKPDAKSDAKPTIREVVAVVPWCANGRVIGSGQGFCEIN